MSLYVGTITCVDRNGTPGKFDLFDAQTLALAPPQAWRFYAVPHGKTPETSEDIFELALEESGPSSAQIVMMAHHYRGGVRAKGIPEVLLPFVSQRVGRAIHSSSNKGGLGAEYRTGDATKVWQRLAKNGQAIYDGASDVYHLAPSSATVPQPTMY